MQMCPKEQAEQLAKMMASDPAFKARLNEMTGATLQSLFSACALDSEIGLSGSANAADSQEKT